MENPNGVEKWVGESPTVYEGNFDTLAVYYVFVDSDNIENISVEIIDGDDMNYFTPCEQYGDCDMYHLANHTYIGQMNFGSGGDWSVNFTGEGSVTITELTFDLGDIMSFSGGFLGICCSLFILIIGFVMIFALKQKPPMGGVMMVQQADGTIHPVGGGMPGQQMAPQTAAPMVAGAVHPAFTQNQPQTQMTQNQGQILPSIGGQQPPNQGF